MSSLMWFEIKKLCFQGPPKHRSRAYSFSAGARLLLVTSWAKAANIKIDEEKNTKHWLQKHMLLSLHESYYKRGNYLAHGLWKTGEERDWTTNLVISRQPALPPELQVHMTIWFLNLPGNSKSPWIPGKTTIDVIVSKTHYLQQCL